jgi:hypothetical protein
MMGSAMTILMGMYSDDHADVAIISDRRSTPNSIGRAAGMHPREDVYKTLRLGPQVAIGFAGTVPLSNFILAELLGLPPPDMVDDILTDLVAVEEEFDYGFDRVVRLLNERAWAAIEWASPPPGIQASAILAGVDDGRPILAELSAATGWEVRPAFTGGPYSGPLEMTDEGAKAEFENFVSKPGLDYIASLKAAVKFCADRYSTVNHNYVLRRLKTGFRREEGQDEATQAA